MFNSQSLCQYFVYQPLKMICKQLPQCIVYHYMYDILLADSNVDTEGAIMGLARNLALEKFPGIHKDEPS